MRLIPNHSIKTSSHITTVAFQKQKMITSLIKAQKSLSKRSGIVSTTEAKGDLIDSYMERVNDTNSVEGLKILDTEIRNKLNTHRGFSLFGLKNTNSLNTYNSEMGKENPHLEELFNQLQQATSSIQTTSNKTKIDIFNAIRANINDKSCTLSFSEVKQGQQLEFKINGKTQANFKHYAVDSQLIEEFNKQTSEIDRVNLLEAKCTPKNMVAKLDAIMKTAKKNQQDTYDDFTKRVKDIQQLPKEKQDAALNDFIDLWQKANYSQGGPAKPPSSENINIATLKRYILKFDKFTEWTNDKDQTTNIIPVDIYNQPIGNIRGHSSSSDNGDWIEAPNAYKRLEPSTLIMLNQLNDNKKKAICDEINNKTSASILSKFEDGSILQRTFKEIGSADAFNTVYEASVQALKDHDAQRNSLEGYKKFVSGEMITEPGAKEEKQKSNSNSDMATKIQRQFKKHLVAKKNLPTNKEGFKVTTFTDKNGNKTEYALLTNPIDATKYPDTTLQAFKLPTENETTSKEGAFNRLTASNQHTVAFEKIGEENNQHKKPWSNIELYNALGREGSAPRYKLGTLIDTTKYKEAEQNFNNSTFKNTHLKNALKKFNTKDENDPRVKQAAVINYAEGIDKVSKKDIKFASVAQNAGVNLLTYLESGKNKMSLDNYISLLDTLKKDYHKKGLVHLDIKEENTMVKKSKFDKHLEIKFVDSDTLGRVKGNDIRMPIYAGTPLNITQEMETELFDQKGKKDNDGLLEYAARTADNWAALKMLVVGLGLVKETEFKMITNTDGTRSNIKPLKELTPKLKAFINKEVQPWERRNIEKLFLDPLGYAKKMKEKGEMPHLVDMFIKAPTVA